MRFFLLLTLFATSFALPRPTVQGTCPTTISKKIIKSCPASTCADDTQCTVAGEKCCPVSCKNGQVTYICMRAEPELTEDSCPTTIPEKIKQDCPASVCNDQTPCPIAGQRCCPITCTNGQVTHVCIIGEVDLQRGGQCPSPIPERLIESCPVSNCQSDSDCTAIDTSMKCCSVTCKNSEETRICLRTDSGLKGTDKGLKGRGKGLKGTDKGGLKRAFIRPQSGGQCPSRIPERLVERCPSAECQTDSDCHAINPSMKCCPLTCKNSEETRVCLGTESGLKGTDKGLKGTDKGLKGAIIRPQSDGQCPSRIPEHLIESCPLDECQTDSDCTPIYPSMKCCPITCQNSEERRLCLETVSGLKGAVSGLKGTVSGLKGAFIRPQGGQCPTIPRLERCPATNCQTDSDCTAIDASTKCCSVTCENNEETRICLRTDSGLKGTVSGLKGAFIRPQSGGQCPTIPRLERCPASNCQTDSDCTAIDASMKCCSVTCENNEETRICLRTNSGLKGTVSGLKGAFIRPQSEPHSGSCPTSLSTEELLGRCPSKGCTEDTECASTQKCCPLVCKAGNSACVTAIPDNNHRIIEKTGSSCSTCKSVIDELKKMIRENPIEPDVQAAVSQVCSRVPPSEMSDCNNLISVHEKMIINLWLYGTPPDLICPIILGCTFLHSGQCPTEIPKTLKDMCPPSECQSDQNCLRIGPSGKCCPVTCTSGHQINICYKADSGYNGEFILQISGGQCPSRVPERLVERCPSAECQTDSDCAAINPSMKCCPLTCKNNTETRVCLGTELSKVSVPVSCATCQNFIYQIRQLIPESPTNSDITTAFNEVCSRVLASERDRCANMVSTYRESITNLWISGVPPELMCSEIELCDLLNSGQCPTTIPKSFKDVCPPSECQSDQDCLRFDPSAVCCPITCTSGQQIKFCSDIFHNREFIRQISGLSMSVNDSCQTCTIVIDELKKLIPESPTIEDITTEINRVCSLVPATETTACTNMLATFGPTIIHLWASGVPPEQICSKIQACSLLGSGQCPANIPRTIKDTCPQSECQSDQDCLRFDPSAVCCPVTCTSGNQIKMCSDILHNGEFIRQISEISMSVRDSCETCGIVIDELKKLIPESPTMSDFTSAFTKVCSLVEASERDACTNIITTYGKNIIDLWITNVPPENICSMIQVCSLLSSGQCPANIPEMLKDMCPRSECQSDQDCLRFDPSAICCPVTCTSGNQIKMCSDILHNGEFIRQISEISMSVRDSCETCGIVVDELKKLVPESPTMSDFTSAFTKVCSLVEASERDACTNIITTYGKNIIDLWITNVPPENICSMIQVCSLLSSGQCPADIPEALKEMCPQSDCNSNQDCLRYSPSAICCPISCTAGHQTNLCYEAYSGYNGEFIQLSDSHSCPELLSIEELLGHCPSTVCSSDSECNYNERCCSVQCRQGGHACVITEGSALSRILKQTEPHSGLCPAFPVEARGGKCPTTDCETDETCDVTQKCCRVGCKLGRVCVKSVPKIQLQELDTQHIDKKKDIKKPLLPDPRPEDIIPESDNRIRWCVVGACELKKCLRMVNEFTYNLSPRKDWRCIEAKSKEQCLQWVSKKYADVVVTRVDDVYTAIKKYELKPIVYEAPVVKGSESEALNVWETITLAITKRDNSEINRWSDLRGKKSCHAGIQEAFSFKAPVCSLINKEIIPRKGDYIESASHYFSGSCIPGILDHKYNVHSTYPVSLCDACAKNSGLCDMKLDRYAGVEGSLQCLHDSKGEVTFIDRKFLEKLISDGRASTLKVICEGETIDLQTDQTSWKTKKTCQLAVTPRPTIVVHPQKTPDYITSVIDLLTKAARNYGKKSVSSFKLFESVSYKCEINEGESVYKKDIIFRDAESEETRELVTITDDKPFARQFIEDYTSCMTLTPKPRAKFCVTLQAAYDKCMEMKENFDKTDLVNEVAWGCVKELSAVECMRAVFNGTADLLSTNPTETFIAGHDFRLHPILSQYFDTLTADMYTGNTKKSFGDNTYTLTIGVMKKNRLDEIYGSDVEEISTLRGLKTCHAGMKHLSSFHHPIGWLLANGSIPRVGSIFETVNRYFNSSCLPGADPKLLKLDSDLLIGHEINWGIKSLNVYNFTGFDWFVWNSPATWTYYNWNKQTPRTLQKLLEDIDKELGISTGKHETQQDLDWDLLQDIINVPAGVTPISNPDDTVKLNMILKKIKRKDSDHLMKDDRMLTERMERLGEVLQFLHNIPTIREARTTDWLNHPAVLSYLQIYYPSMISYHSSMFDDAEIRKREFNRYNNPIWLSTRYVDYLNVMQAHQKEMCKSCIGEGDNKCQDKTTVEPYHGYSGALRCLEENGGDISFFEAHKFQELLDADGQKRPEDYALICPTGEVVIYEKNIDVIEKCNFGRVPYAAVVTAQNRTGTWRWNVTKALLEAQKVFDGQASSRVHKPIDDSSTFNMFGENSVFDVSTTEIKPVDILNQTHHTYLGPQLLRSMEAIIKPSNLDWWKQDPHKCYGETYSSVIVEEKEGTKCNAIVKDVTCVGTPPRKVISLGRYGLRQDVTVDMCSRPTKGVKKLAEFTCEDGTGYLKDVMMPVNCECVPCTELTYTSDWIKDKVWKTDAKLYQRNRDTTKETNYDLWGNKLEGRSV